MSDSGMSDLIFSNGYSNFSGEGAQAPLRWIFINRGESSDEV
jgi:hypothetical protein